MDEVLWLGDFRDAEGGRIAVRIEALREVNLPLRAVVIRVVGCAVPHHRDRAWRRTRFHPWEKVHVGRKRAAGWIHLNRRTPRPALVR